MQSLYGKRTWAGGVSSPLLFAGQYEDAESGWVYNRFRYYQPVVGSYNAQDPLGLAPRVASGQGYVDHAAFWGRRAGLHKGGHIQDVKNPHPTIPGRDADGTFRSENPTASDGRRTHDSYSDFMEAQGYRTNVQMPGETRLRPDALKFDDDGYIRVVRELKPDSPTGQQRSVEQLSNYRIHAEFFNNQKAAELGQASAPQVRTVADWYTP